MLLAYKSDLGAAREEVRVARALGTLPLLAQALARGELFYAKVRLNGLEALRENAVTALPEHRVIGAVVRDLWTTDNRSAEP